MRALGIVSSLAIVAMTSGACTVVSGVDDFEIKKVVDPPGASTSPNDPKAPPLANDKSTGVPSGKPNTSGPALCGAQGSWQACEPPPTTVLATCADSCRARGLACVDDCCLENNGPHRYQAGSVYSMPQLLCSLDAPLSNTTGGLCNDPLFMSAMAGMQVRCCCK